MFLYYCDPAGHKAEPWKFRCVKKESKASSGRCLFAVYHFSLTPPPRGGCGSNPFKSPEPTQVLSSPAQCCLLGNEERHLTPSLILATERTVISEVTRLKGHFYYCFVKSWWKTVPLLCKTDPGKSENFLSTFFLQSDSSNYLLRPVELAGSGPFACWRKSLFCLQQGACMLQH